MSTAQARDPGASAEAPGTVTAFPGGRADPAADPAELPASSWSGPMWAGLAVLAVAFGGLGVWAATAPLDSAVVARGTVVVESNRKLVEHVDGGSVTEVLVDEGDRVEPGQLLARMDAREALPVYRAARARLDDQLAERARLVAERDGAARANFPPELTRRGDESGIAGTLAGERRQFRERRRSLQARVAVEGQRIEQFRRQIAGIEAERAGLVRQAGLLREELSGLTELMEKGFYPRIRVLERRRELARLEGRQGRLSAEIARTSASIGEARARIRRIEQSFREKAVSRLRAVETEIAQTRQRAIQTRARLERTNVLAGFAGVVHALQVRSPGAVIEPGGQLMQIVPVGDVLVIRARVAPQDVDDVAPGQRANVRLTALGGATTPVLAGEVDRVSPDRIEDRESGRAYYSARVVIPAGQLAKLRDERLKAGMPAEVMIGTGERTLVDYLWKPVSDAMSRGLIEP